jgi:hypothetical protein
MQQPTLSSDNVSRSQPDMFAGVTSILVKEIVDLREMLAFYELQLFQAEINEPLDPNHPSAVPARVASGHRIAGPGR